MLEANQFGIEGQFIIREYPQCTEVYLHHTFESFVQALKNGRPRVILQYIRDYEVEDHEDIQIHSYRAGFIDGLRGRVHIYEVKGGNIKEARKRVAGICHKGISVYSGYYDVDIKTGDIYEVYQEGNINHREIQSVNWFGEVSRIFENLEDKRQATLNITAYRKGYIFVDFRIDKIHMVTILNYRDSVYQKLSRLFN